MPGRSFGGTPLPKAPGARQSSSTTTARPAAQGPTGEGTDPNLDPKAVGGAGGPPKVPFDLSKLGFPMVFPMPPIDPVNPARLPLVPPPADARFQKTVSMLEAYAGEETGRVFGQKVQYLNETERQAFKVTVKDGLLQAADGSLFDTQMATTSGEVTGRAIYVMDHDGNMYMSNKAGIADFQHTSFLAGQPVAAAGDIRVEEGVIQEISRKSGHYRPPADLLDQIVDHLKSQGVPADFQVRKDV